MKQVTVIVPIYKVEKYLRACFESLLKQTSDDFVVLAVNDGSPDNCDAIIKEYVEKYPEKIKGIKKENGGYGSVLQLAIKVIDTPYFLVCDPDDTLRENAVETLLNLAKMSNSDITIGAKYFVYEDSEEQDYHSAYNSEFVTLKSNTVYKKGQDMFNDLFFVDPSPHAKLYRKTVAEHITFPEHVSYTDNLLFYLSLLNSQTVIYTDEALAYYLVNRKGNSMGDVSFSAMNGEIRVFKTIVNQAEYVKDVPDIFWYRMYESFKFMLYQTRNMKCTKDQYDETLDYLETYLFKLPKYRDAILAYYKKYEHTKIIEKIRDRLLINEKTSHRTYQNLKKKMVEEFEGV